MMTLKKILELASAVPESQRETTLVYFEIDKYSGTNIGIELKEPRRTAFLAKSIVFVRDTEFKQEEAT
jgi:hypothetical protein